MSGNEILLNLDQVENLRKKEILAGLLELSKRDRHFQHDWNNHPFTQKCIQFLKQNMSQYNAANTIQIAMAMDRLNILDKEMWNKVADRLMLMVHKLKFREYADCLYLFDKDLRDERGESLSIRKAEPEFFEKIVSLMPVHVKRFDQERLVNTLEILVKKNLGSERLFLNYILFYIERKSKGFHLNQFTRTIYALADKQFSEDPVFWENIFKYVTKNQYWTVDEAKKIWDSLTYLRLKSPMVNVDETMKYIEKYLVGEDDI